MNPPDASRGQLKDIIKRIRELPVRPMKLMEVCGTHTVAVFHAGIRNTLLAERGIQLVSGPGCPVCVTAAAEIDDVSQLALRDTERIIVTAYGDLFRAKGHQMSLAEARASGARVKLVTSAFDNIRLAEEFPEKQVVFFGIGFETTQPGLAHTVLEAERRELANFSVYVSHKLVIPALKVLAEDPRLELDGFILPGHVSTIIGEKPYAFLATEYGIPGVIAGFESADIVLAVYHLLAMQEEGQPRIVNAYPRAVRPCGNQRAQEMIGEVFEPIDACWRGIGAIPKSGHRLRERFTRFDAHKRFSLQHIVEDEAGFGMCRCGDVLRGLLSPPDCGLFGTACTPDSPLGACMVSAEGACSNYYRFGQLR